MTGLENWQLLETFRFAPDDILLAGRESAGVPDAVHAAADARLASPDTHDCLENPMPIPVPLLLFLVIGIITKLALTKLAMKKSRAVLIHFLFSLLLVSGVLAVIFFIWYPAPMFQINGADTVLRVLIGVDLVLGPALTAYLYRPGKKGLWIDMWFIAIVQLTALVYGTSVIYSERPQYMIWSQDRFVILAGKDVPDVEGGKPVCETIETLPCVAVAVLPNTVAARGELLETTLATGLELEQLAEYWRPLADYRERVLDKSLDLAWIAEQGPEWAAAVAAVVRASGRTQTDLRYVPVINKNLDASALIIDATTAMTVDVIDIDPWQIRR